MVEITSRTVQGRLLLKPSDELNEIILGILGRALYLFPAISLFAYYFLSNHFHMMIQTPDALLMSQFMCYVNSNLAKEAGFIYKWKEKFWGRRYRSIAVLDEESMVDRLKYILGQGVNHCLVASPEQWNGVHCVNALLSGVEDSGWWFERSKEARARSRGRNYDMYQYAIKYRVRLSPIPCWAHLPEEERQGKCAELVKEIKQEGKAKQEMTGKAPLGQKAISLKEPHDKPQKVKKSPAPFVHAKKKSVRKAFRKAYKEFVRAFADAAVLLAQGKPDVKFPPCSFPPPASFVPPFLVCSAPSGIPP